MNSYVPLQLPENVRDLFSLAYKPPGKISPGISIDMSLTFHPSLLISNLSTDNGDFSIKLPFLSETGSFDIPVICKSKKSILGLTSDNVIRILRIIAKDTETVGSFVIENSGALGDDIDVVSTPIDYDAAPSSIRELHGRATEDVGKFMIKHDKLYVLVM